MCRVEYWQISLTQLGRSPDLWPLLNDAEQERALSFRFVAMQQRYMLARGALRQIVSYYCQLAPQAIAFNYGPFGKPLLPNLAFNLSHTETLALCAVALEFPQAQLGVDVELQQRPCQVMALAKRCYTPTEYQRLARLPPEARQSSFLQLWTAKEAYLKARGVGLQGGLDSVSVQLQSKPQLQGPDTADWSLHLFAPDLDHFGAIAIDQLECEFINRGEWIL